jgi:hypothetical protein
MRTRRCAKSVKPARLSRATRGLSAIYTVFVLVAMVAFVSLAVDIGRIRLARTELQVATDAAARAGADSLPISHQATIDNACDAAEENGVIDAQRSGNNHLGERTNPGVALIPSDDLEVGIWDPKTRTFTVLDDTGGTVIDERRKANAVHATGRRITERNTPVPLIFGPVIGVFSSDIERQAIAYITGGPDKFGFVGLDFVKATGNFSAVDSVLLPSKTRRNNGWVGSNGNIDLGNGDVYGDARPGVGKQILQNPNSIITGWQANLDQPLVYKADTFAPPGGANDNGLVTPPGTVNGSDFKANGSANVPAGKYVFTGWTQSGSGTVTITAPANIWINGDFNMGGTGKLVINATGTNAVRFWINGNLSQSGGTIINNGMPSALSFSVTKANTNVDLSGGTDMRAHVYAPLSNVTITGVPGFYGWIIGKSLTFKGTAQLHYDESRNDFVPYKVTLVR